MTLCNQPRRLSQDCTVQIWRIGYSVDQPLSIFLGVIFLGMNKPRPWKCLWTSLKKQTKNENTKMFWGALNTSLFSHNHSKFSAWQESNTTSDITTPFWPGQDGHQFWAQPANFEQLKSSFPLPYTKKRLAMFSSEVQTLLFQSKNLTNKNFISV